MLDLSKLEKVIGVSAWLTEERPYAILLRPYGFIVYEEATPRRGGCSLALLMKKCVDTLNAVKRAPVKLNFAGLKDAEGYTAQYVSAKGRLTAVYTEDDIILAPADSEYCISRGDVRANHFAVSIITDECRITSYAPNYYGFQRFGTRRPNTHIIGKMLVLDDYAGIIEELTRIKYPYESGRLGSYEYRIYSMLQKTHNLLDLLRAVPRQLLELFVNAYQSYLFNRILSILVEDYGQKLCKKYLRIPVPGCKLDTNSLGELNEYYRIVFDEEGISEDDLCRARRYGITASSYYRETCIRPLYAVCVKVELFDEKLYTILFALPRGSYATTWLANSYRLLETYPDLMPCQFA